MNSTQEIVTNLGGFEIRPLTNGLLFDESHGMYPTKMWGYVGDSKQYFGSETSTVYGIVYEGEVVLEQGDKEKGQLTAGQYFSVVGEFALRGTGKITLVERLGFRGVFTIGGPIENRGRLSYIDGCSDSLLIYPPRLGDPVFNVLWFPHKIRQTMHIHPTIRFGFVIHGHGRCVTPEGEVPLLEGYVFKLSEMSQHCFFTDDSRMAIVAYHPDSDWGPTDGDHPMLNRTLIQGR
ncbi:cupin domain-containing protein [Paenibacillus sp. Dod16]|uniref:hypothetical protein n=1 Tax=Paenibacillus sp. Dod16 TaxID=3416392 RepID=UPI003CF20289